MPKKVGPEAWPADVVERRAVSELIPYARNPRTHSPSQVTEIAASIRHWGWTNPVLIDEDGGIIAGHGRVLAAQELGIVDVPTIVARGWSDAQKRAFVIADNKLTLNGGWNDDLLKVELAGLEAMDFDLTLTGFSELELATLLTDANAGLTDPDDVPETPADPVSELGDVWVLGKHRVMCGDAVSVDAAGKLIAGAAVDLVLTDPPYGVAVVKDGMVGANFGVARKGRYQPIIGDDTTDTAIEAYGVCLAIGAQKLVLWGGNYFADKLPPSSCWLVWDKRGDTGIVNTFADCEMAWTSMAGPARIHRQVWNGMIREGEKDKRVHPTQKPVALCEWAIGSYTGPTERVLDLFLGSASTLIACEKTGRICFGMELSPAYVDVAVQRWQAFTGQAAVLEATGQTFAETEAHRQPQAAVKAAGPTDTLAAKKPATRQRRAA